MKRVLLWTSGVALASMGVLLLLTKVTGTHWFQMFYFLPYIVAMMASGNAHQPSAVVVTLALFAQQFDHRLPYGLASRPASYGKARALSLRTPFHAGLAPLWSWWTLQVARERARATNGRSTLR